MNGFDGFENNMQLPAHVLCFWSRFFIILQLQNRRTCKQTLEAHD